MGTAISVVVDGGLDDALALAVLYGSGAQIDQVVATEGSLSRSLTARATKRWVETIGATAPVLLGADRGLQAEYPAGRDPFHGIDAFGGSLSTLTSASDPADLWHELKGTVLCTGALTVVADALGRSQPIDELVWMGGAVASGGNMTAAAEFNAWMDPTAADRVLTSGISMHMVPLDVTNRFIWRNDEIQALRDAGPGAALLAGAIDAVLRRDGQFIPHDAVATVALLQPDLFDWSMRSVRCEPTGVFTAGATVVDRRYEGVQGSVAVAADVDVAQVTDRVIRAVSQLG